MTPKIILRFAALTAILSGLPLPGQAGVYGEAPPDQVVSAEILTGWRDGTSHVAALRLRLAPGWKTYWRAPGEGGIPPQFDWTGSRNLQAVELDWPTPQVFVSNGMRSIGYADELVLPLLLTVERGQAVSLSMTLSLGVCEDVCMPYDLSVQATLPADARPMDPAILAAQASRPRSAAEAGVGAVVCAVVPIADGLRLTARIPLPAQGGAETVVFEAGHPGIWVSETEATRTGNILTAVADLVPPDARPFPLDRSELRITVIGKASAVDIRGCSAG